MRAVLSRRASVFSERDRRAEKRAAAGSSGGVENSLLQEIGRLAGEERKQGVERALKTFQTSLDELVRKNPTAYGAGADSSSQTRVVTQLVESVSISFLRQTIDALRREAGFVRVWGWWIHRAAFTFVSFGVLAAAVLPLCAVSLMSTFAWGWAPGALGIVAALFIGAWILSRIRTR